MKENRKLISGMIDHGLGLRDRLRSNQMIYRKAENIIDEYLE